MVVRRTAYLLQNKLLLFLTNEVRNVIRARWEGIDPVGLERRGEVDLRSVEIHWVRVRKLPPAHQLGGGNGLGCEPGEIGRGARL